MIPTKVPFPLGRFWFANDAKPLFLTTLADVVVPSLIRRSTLVPSGAKTEQRTVRSNSALFTWIRAPKRLSFAADICASVSILGTILARSVHDRNIWAGTVLSGILD